MAEQNEQCGGLCASPALIAVALAAALIVPVAGFFVAQLLHEPWRGGHAAAHPAHGAGRAGRRPRAGPGRSRRRA